LDKLLILKRLDHVAFCTSAHSHSKLYDLKSSSRVFQFASYAFDASIIQLLTTLIVGGVVCVPSEDDRKSSIAKSINGLNANWVDLTPSVARIINPEDILGVKTMVLAGEPMSFEDIRKWARLRLIQAVSIT